MFACRRLPNIVGPRNCMFTVHLKRLACQKMRPESLTTKCSEELREPPGTVCLWPLPEIPVPHPASVWLKCSVEGASCSTSSAPNLCPYPLFSTIDRPHDKSCASHDLPRSTVPSVHVWPCMYRMNVVM